MRTYIGKGKIKQFESGGIVFDCCLDIEKAKIYHSKNGKDYIYFTIGDLKEPDQYGNSKTLYQWTPDQKESQPIQSQPEDDLLF